MADAVNYTTVVVAKPKRRSAAKKGAAKRNHAASGVIYTTIMHVMPTTEKKPDTEVKADAAEAPEAEVHAEGDTNAYRVLRSLPKQVDLVKGEEIACTRFNADEYFMKGRVMRTGQACHLPTDRVEKSSHSKYVFVVKTDYDAMDIQQGDILKTLEHPEEGWMVGTTSRNGKRGFLPDNFVERDFSQRGVFKAQFSYEASRDDEISLVDGDVIINTDVTEGTIQRTGQICTLPQEMLEGTTIREDPEDVHAEIANDKTEADGEVIPISPKPADKQTKWGKSNSSRIMMKVVAVGDGASGKTCLFLRLSADAFTGVYIPTVFDNYSVDSRLHGKQVHLSLWDTAGMDDYDRLRPLSYPDTDIYLACYSIDWPPSLQHVKEKWVPEIRHYSPDAPIILVGNKKDLRDDEVTLRELSKRNQRPVSKVEGHVMAGEIEAVDYLECSAKTNTGLQAIFEAVVKAGIKAEKTRKTKCTVQ